MKITKSQLKQLIVEELSADAELLKTMNKLAGSIDSLDVSIDYLTSTISGEDPFGIDLLQKRFGRFAKPGAKRAASLDEGQGGEGSMAVRQLNNLSQMVQELQAMVDESDDHEEWVESKITKAHDYINTVLNYLSGADPVNEKIEDAGDGNYYATSKSGRRLSKKPKSKKDAQAQLAAVEISKAERGKK